MLEVPGRREAFAAAVAMARPGDTVVAAGRGSDTLQRYGSRVLTFDDHAELHAAIVTARRRALSPVAP